jgi:diamine N-acetyltransferase
LHPALDSILGAVEVTLRDIDVDNWRECVDLQVREDQRAFALSPAVSLVEAHYGICRELLDLVLVPKAIYAGEQMVGFMMFNHGPDRDRIVVMRLMVDARFQGHGYGRTAMRQWLDEVKREPQLKEIAIGVARGNHGVYRLYSSLGFEDAYWNGGEFMMVMTLKDQSEPWESYWMPADRSERGSWDGV